MQRKTILITGATDGIGLATAVALGRRGHRIILHGRSAERLEQSVVDVRNASGADEHEIVRADFSSLEEVMSMVMSLTRRGGPLHVLINNAGVYMKDRRLTRDGFEMTFAVNHLSHFLLTLGVLELLREGRPARIVNVSSVSHRRGRMNFSDLHGDQGYSAYEAYAQSKLANVLFTHSLSSRLDADEVTANALHPGVISTKLLRAGFSMSGASLDEGAATSVYLATAPELDGVSNRYFANSAEKAAEDHARHAESAEQLWNASIEMIRSVIPGWTPIV